MHTSHGLITPLRVVAATLALVTGYIWHLGGDKFVIESIGELIMLPVCLAACLPSPWDQNVAVLIMHQNRYIGILSLIPLGILFAAAIVAFFSILRHSLLLCFLSTGLILAMLLTFHLTKHNFVTYYPVEAVQNASGLP